MEAACIGEFYGHGECVGHEPELKELETQLRPMGFWRRYEAFFVLYMPLTIILVPLWFITPLIVLHHFLFPKRCCGTAMRPAYEVKLMRCEKCMKARLYNTYNEWLRCACCGRQQPLRPDNGYDC